MKLLVFAHVPPPHHGQSYMVRLMLDGFGGDQRKGGTKKPANGSLGVSCYHVNARVSKELEDIGDFRITKLVLLFGYCVQAIWCRFRYGVTTLYYIPAPGKHSALYRDWMVMLLCRPFFKKIILHWHAAGLAKWLETNVQIRSRSFTFRQLRGADLSIVLSKYNRADAEKLFPKRISVVSNGIPDPCPDFAESVLRRRKARFAARVALAAGREPEAADRELAGGDPHRFKVLFLAHCTREKGLFDTLKGVLWANQKLAEKNSPFSIELTVGGNFLTNEERAEFDRICATPEGSKCVRYAGFLAGPQKLNALREADLFCFPTFYQNENQPVNLIEAMAFGLPILATRWRSIPELFPAGYPWLVDIGSPAQIADTLLACLTTETAEFFRDIFFSHYTLEQYLAGLAGAIQSVESTGPSTAEPALGASPSRAATLPPQAR